MLVVEENKEFTAPWKIKYGKEMMFFF